MAVTTANADVNLRAYLQVIWRRKLTVVLTMLICVGAMIAYDSTLPPQYQASTRFLLTTSVQATNRQVTAAIYTMTSPQVMFGARAAVKAPCPQPSITQVGQTGLMNIQIVSGDPQVAANCANAIVASYVKFIESQTLNRNIAYSFALSQQIQKATAAQSEVAAKLVTTTGRLGSWRVW